MHSTFGMLFLW